MTFALRAELLHWSTKKVAQNATLAATVNANVSRYPMHKTQEELLKELEKLNSKVKVGDKFSHYKHPESFYKIVAVGLIESSETPCLVYQAEYGDKLIWVRTEDEFFAKVTLDNGGVVDRFSKVS